EEEPIPEHPSVDEPSFASFTLTKKKATNEWLLSAAKVISAMKNPPDLVLGKDAAKYLLSDYAKSFFQKVLTGKVRKKVDSITQLLRASRKPLSQPLHQLKEGRAKVALEVFNKILEYTDVSKNKSKTIDQELNLTRFIIGKGLQHK